MQTSPAMTIDFNQVDLWQAFPAQLQNSKMLDELKALLTDEELALINSCRRPSERNAKIIARIFVRSVLAKYSQVSAKQLLFRKSLHGKPEIINDGVNLSFNLSHCKDIMICAVTRGAAVGVDIEKIRYKPSLIQINDFLFSPEEKADMDSLQGAAQQRRFFDYWTLKESYIKATGAGLTTPLHKIGFVPGFKSELESKIESGTAVAKIKLELNEEQGDKNWHSWLWSIGHQYRLALTIDKAHQAPTGIRCFHFLPTYLH